MNRNLVLISAIGVSLISGVGMAQTPSAPAPAPATSPATLPPPQAVPAKIALVAFEQAVFATNEGQKAVQDVQQKYAPKKAQIETLSNEIDGLKKQLSSLPATTTEADRASRQRAIDSKDKELQREADDAQTAYNADLQESYAKVAQKFSVTLKNYVAQNGYTLLLDVSSQQSPVMWASAETNIDVTDAVVKAYNASSGVAAPAPAAPSASRPRPAGPTTAPKPAAPKVAPAK